MTLSGRHAALRLVLLLLLYMLAVAACTSLLYTAYYEPDPVSLPHRVVPAAPSP